MNRFTLTAHNRDVFCEKVHSLDPTRLYDFEWREKKSKRTLAQNDWARKYARDFGKHFGYDADFAYDMLMYKFNPVFTHDLEGNEIRTPGHFSKLETAQAAEVQDMMLRYGLENGFYWNE